MIVYLDSSVVLRPLLAQPGRLQSWGKWTAAYSSELLGIECRRAIDRLRLEGLYDDEQMAKAIEELIRIERTIKRIRLSQSAAAPMARIYIICDGGDDKRRTWRVPRFRLPFRTTTVALMPHQ
jgi:hypothetical protein